MTSSGGIVVGVGVGTDSRLKLGGFGSVDSAKKLLS